MIAGGMVLGLIGAGCMVAKGLTDMRQADRFVTVKGLVEREMKADLGVWSLPLRMAGNELADVQAQLDATQGKLRDILKSKSFRDDEIEAGSLRIVDRKAQEYSNFEDQKQFRYILTSTLVLRTAEVDKLHALSQGLQELAKAGVVLAADSGCTSQPSYSFTKLNELKPEMLAEATKNARASAQQFANDAASRVGNIRQASQGVFSITGRDEIQASDGAGCASDDRHKKVRVVTTVDYTLE